MAAPDIETIYDFETHFESPAVTFLNTATGISVVRTVVETDLTTPRIEIRFEMHDALDPAPLRGGGASAGTIDYRAFNANFFATVVTDNATGQAADHSVYRRQVREALSLSGTNWTTVNNPYYDLKYCRPIATDYEADGDFNLSTMSFAIVFGIRDDAWPA